MTDVEASTPGKRKSFPNKQGKKGSPKKFAPDTKTPQKVKALNKGVTPKKQNSSPNKQNSNQKPINKKNRQNSESGSPKKLKPFAGTSDIQTPTAEKGNKKVKNENTAERKEERKRKRKGQFYHLTEKAKSGEKDVIKTLEDKIKAIESRGELTKTAKKKIKILIRLKNIAEGKPPGQAQQAKSLDSKSASTKRHERKKKALLNVKEASKTVKPADVKTNGKANQKGKPGNKQVAKKPKLELKVDDSDGESEEDESDEVEEESEDEESGAENAEEESDDEVEGEDSNEENEDSGEEEQEDSDENDDEEDESEEETPPQEEESDPKDAAPRKKIKREKTGNQTKNGTPVNLDELKKSNLVGKNQKRFVLFVGNIPYDTNKLDLIEHFKKCGEIKHIRIPTEKKSSKPRGFAYVEVGNEETYQKCLSIHHSTLKGRRINVLYTQGGKKKGEEKKKEIKAKNFKLHAMRKQGKLVGSKKETQKRSFRRAKQRTFKSEQESRD